MIGTLMRRVTVRTLDAVVDRGKASGRAPVRLAAGVLDRARTVVGLHEVNRDAPLPDWSGRHPERPMWESDRKKMEKWQAEQGINKTPAEEKPKPKTKTNKKSIRLPVVDAGGHPEHSPFEDLPVEDVAPSERLEGDELVARVKAVLDECRPLVQADGGDIELLDVQDDTVHVQLTGNCIGCPSSQATLKQGIERRLIAQIPQITQLKSPQLV